MTQDNPNRYDLSRRKVLGGLTAVGVASVGAGLGTSAYFSDQETFNDNVLTAGALDLKVDWEEHYSDWSDDESEGLEGPEGGDAVVMVHNQKPKNVPEGYVGLPDPTQPLIAVYRDDLSTFMDNTAIESFPDPDDDGVQGGGEFVYEPCTHGADTPADLDPTNGYRTLSTDTVDDLDAEDPEPAPLINLQDVKPGDFGEVTFSFHLCDNDGYVWMNGALDQEMTGENGFTEPERKDPDEVEDTVELLDMVQTAMWYDSDGDNVIDTGSGGGVPCVQIVLDASGSMSSGSPSRNQQAIDGAKMLADAIISAGGRVGVTFFSASGYSTGAQVQQSVGSADATDVAATQNVIDTLPANGGDTAIGEGILTADEDLANCSDDQEPVQVVVTDGQNNAGTAPSTAADDVTGTDSNDYTSEIYAIGTGGATESGLLAFARPQDDIHAELTDDLTEVIGNLAAVIGPEDVFFRGTLREALDVLGSGNGIALDGNQSTAFTEVTQYGNDDGNPSDPTAAVRECFPGGETNYIGFAWWLPVDHGNEAQTDSVGFDLGFYTEQCRHNTGAGMAPESTSTPT